MTDQTTAPAQAQAPVPAGPTHYRLMLARPWPIPGTRHEVPAGDITVIASLVLQMPEDIIISKTPVTL